MSFTSTADTDVAPESDPNASLEDLAARLEDLLPSVLRRILGTPVDSPLSVLPLAQLRLCTLLLRDGRRTMSQISDDLRISVSAVTQMADRLEKAGMVERVAETDGDRRTRHLQLTPHGNDLMTARRAQRVSRAGIVLQSLPQAQRIHTIEVLAALMEASRNFPAVPSYHESSL